MPESLSYLYPVSQLAENQPQAIGRPAVTATATTSNSSSIVNNSVIISIPDAVGAGASQRFH